MTPLFSLINEAFYNDKYDKIRLQMNVLETMSMWQICMMLIKLSNIMAEPRTENYPSQTCKNNYASKNHRAT
jgi:hypothetical protein